MLFVKLSQMGLIAGETTQKPSEYKLAGGALCMLQIHLFWQWRFKGRASTSDFQRLTEYLFLSASFSLGNR